MLEDMKKGVAPYRKKCKTIARHFDYPIEVVNKINQAKTEAELERIMVTARRKYA